MAAETTRRALFGAAGLVAVAAAVPVIAAGTSSAVSPELARLIAEMERIEARSAAFNRDVYDPVLEAWKRIKASHPHVEVDGYKGAVWSTANVGWVLNARATIDANPVLVTDNQREHFAAKQRLVAADEAREARMGACGTRARLDAAHAYDEEYGAQIVEAQDAIEVFPPRTINDLAAKIDFLGARGWFNCGSAAEQVQMDVTQLAAREGR